MLIGEIVAAVVVRGARRGPAHPADGPHDDVHSVEGYHRSIHTLESINAHPAVSSAVAEPGHEAKSAFPESAIRYGRAGRRRSG